MTKKRPYKKLFLVLGLLLVVMMNIPAVAAEDTIYSVTEAHEYTILPGTEEWRALDGAIEKRAACNVTAEEVSSMTTEALIETVINYPLLVDMFAYDTIAEGIEAVDQYFPGLKELLGRSDAMYYLQSYLEQYSLSERNNNIEYIYADSLIHILSLSDERTAPLKPQRSEPTTPNGSSLETYYNRTWSDWGTTYSAQSTFYTLYQNVYNVTALAGIDPQYNCHSYAFYKTTGNHYCIQDPAPYFADGSYYMTSAAPGRKITYVANGYHNHSGIVNSVGSTLSTTYIRSKWGCNGLFYHSITECPFYSASVTYNYWALS